MKPANDKVTGDGDDVSEEPDGKSTFGAVKGAAIWFGLL